MTKREIFTHGPDEIHRHYFKAECKRCRGIAMLIVDGEVPFGYEVECLNPDCKIEPFHSPNLLRGVIMGVICCAIGWCLTVVALSRWMSTIW